MILLRNSHVAFYAAVVTLTFTLALGFGFWFIRGQMLTGNDFLLDAESQDVLARLNRIEPPIDAGKLEAALKEHTALEEGQFYFQVHEPGGKVMYHSPNLGAEALTDLTGGRDKRTLNIPPLGWLRVAEYHTPAVHLQIAMSLRNFQSVSNTFLRVFLIGIPVIALLSAAFGASLRRSTLRPVRLMQAMAARISASNLSERLAIPRTGGEITALARLLNEMIDRLEKSFVQIKRFTADTSHELMTPLSVIRLHAEKLAGDPDLPEKHRRAVEELLQVTLQLAATLERLLLLARADASALPLKLQPLPVHDFITQFAEDAKLLAESRGIRFCVANNEPGTATFDQGLVRQVLFNLLANALRFSPPKGMITLYSRCGAGRWTVEVWDEGPGVPPECLEQIFERFVQLAPRAEHGSGAGLGLAICRSIIELHKGNITAANRKDRRGLMVTFALPLDSMVSDQ